MLRRRNHRPYPEACAKKQFASPTPRVLWKIFLSGLRVLLVRMNCFRLGKAEPEFVYLISIEGYIHRSWLPLPGSALYVPVTPVYVCKKATRQADRDKASHPRCSLRTGPTHGYPEFSVYIHVENSARLHICIRLDRWNCDYQQKAKLASKEGGEERLHLYIGVSLVARIWKAKSEPFRIHRWSGRLIAGNPIAVGCW